MNTEDNTRAITGGRCNDAIVYNHGSLCLVRPLTPAADAWIDDNVHEGSNWFGPSLVVEPRYVADLVAGMRAAGLEVA